MIKIGLATVFNTRVDEAGYKCPSGIKIPAYGTTFERGKDQNQEAQDSKRGLKKTRLGFNIPKKKKKHVKTLPF